MAENEYGGMEGATKAKDGVSSREGRRNPANAVHGDTAGLRRHGAQGIHYLNAPRGRKITTEKEC